MISAACTVGPRHFYADACTANADCESDLCVANRCTKPCTSDATCGGDVCVAHACQPISAIACTDLMQCLAHVSDGPCRIVQCQAGFCALQGKAEGTACSLDACSSAGVCHQGACALSGQPTSCDDAVACTLDVCNPHTGCQHLVTDGLCDDDVACTVDSCDADKGCQHPGDAKACDDQELCTADTCDATGCHHGPKCDDGNACTFDACASTGACANGGIIGMACQDGNPCTYPDVCITGTCLSGPLLGCDDANPCTGDSCDPKTGCQHQPLAGNPCNGACGVGICAAGVCQGSSTTFANMSATLGSTALLVDGAQVVVLGGKSLVQPQIWAVDGTGKPLWSNEQPLSGFAFGQGLGRLASGYAATGGFVSTQGVMSGLVFAVDFKGGTLWQYVSAQAQSQLAAIVAVGDGALAAGTVTTDKSAVWLVHLGPDGKELATATWNAGSGAAALGMAKAGQDALVVGFAQEVGGRAQGLVQRWAMDGKTPQINRTIGASIDRRLLAIAPLDSGWIAMGGEGANKDHVWLVRLDASLQVVWQIVDKAERLPSSLAVDADGLWVTGLRDKSDTGSVAWIGRYDRWGNREFERALPEWSTLGSSGAWPDGGLVVSGSAGKSGLVARLTPWGRATCAASGPCAGLAVAACDDGITCTADDCDAGLGCTHTSLASTAICGSAGPCTLQHCAGQVCKTAGVDDCADTNPCTLDLCTALGCSHPIAPDGTPCQGAGLCAGGNCGY